jgi:Peptidase family C25
MTLFAMKKCRLLLLLVFACINLPAQRGYKNASVLAAGDWYKLAVTEAGVYKVDMTLLNKLGVVTTNLSSSTLRLYGNGGGMLPEACNGTKTDDLVENAIQVMDGGDGVFDGNDYFIFYSNGPDLWIKDSINQRFSHQKNLYSKEAFYYLTLGGTGKRITSPDIIPPSNTIVSSFNERYFYELDSVNFLSSGKNWYGEELSNLPGRLTTQNFSLPLPGVVASSPATVVSSCIGRTIGAASRLTLSINNNTVLQHDIAATGNTNLDLFARSSLLNASFAPAPNLSITYNFSGGGINAQSWIDWFEVFCRRSLAITNTNQLLFRDWASVGSGNVAVFRIQNAAIAQVWDVTNPLVPVKMNATFSGGQLEFTNDAAELHEYVAFSSAFLNPVPVGRIANQNLHNTSPVQLIVVTHPPLLPQARQLAIYHQQKTNLVSVVATTEQIYNEFSGGISDPTAIRDCVKMYYDKAGADSGKRPRYLLLLGDASFDYKSRIRNNTNFVPAYESAVSLDPLSTYTSDDYFGFLNDEEDINSTSGINLLDIGIGRIPAQTQQQAQAYINKLMAYTDVKSLGSWRNEQTFIADDEDFNLHLTDAEVITGAAKTVNPLFLQEKIYLDAYQQESNTAGSRYPLANQAIANKIQTGTLIWNYSGHGGFRRLAEEVILEQPIVESWDNEYRLPLFITATCDFAPYDNPLINSLGENILLREKNGAIALMTTTRLVFAFSNRIMNRNYLEQALKVNANGAYRSLGEAVMLAKNVTYQNQSDVVNNRKFTLLGDPALTLAFPKYRVQTTAINGLPVNQVPDTLKALQKYSFSGLVTDVQGATLTDYTGTVYASVFDKVQSITTRANDPDSYKESFQVQRNLLFRGKARVENGKFSISFIVPKDINYQPGKGRINYYTENGQTDGNGSFVDLIVGGSQGVSNDVEGPTINAFLNDDKFVNGSVVNETPVLLLKLKDSSGINIAGTGIGHDITAMLDGDAEKLFVLNDFFETNLDSYQEGLVRFQLPKLSEGMHRLVIKAWDIANNSNESVIDFFVAREAGFTISRVYNYPNPFTTRTQFWFEHNRPNENLLVHIQIFTITGKLIKTIRQTINTTGNRSYEIEWNARDDFGEKLARGVYIYQLRVTTANKQTAVKLEKLMLL